jgi:hypothetical protein
MCEKHFPFIHPFKKHVFESHDNVQARAKYNRTIEDLVGLSYLKKLRPNVFQQIFKGKFENYIAEMLDPDNPAKFLGLDSVIPLDAHWDDESAEPRKQFYCKQRQMLLRIAETREEEPTICFENLQYVVFSYNQQDIYFDLRHDYKAEYLPNEIANILRWT